MFRDILKCFYSLQNGNVLSSYTHTYKDHSVCICNRHILNKRAMPSLGNEFLHREIMLSPLQRKFYHIRNASNDGSTTIDKKRQDEVFGKNHNNIKQTNQTGLRHEESHTDKSRVLNMSKLNNFVTSINNTRNIPSDFASNKTMRLKVLTNIFTPILKPKQTNYEGYKSNNDNTFKNNYKRSLFVSNENAKVPNQSDSEKKNIQLLGSKNSNKISRTDRDIFKRIGSTKKKNSTVDVTKEEIQTKSINTKTTKKIDRKKIAENIKEPILNNQNKINNALYVRNDRTNKEIKNIMKENKVIATNEKNINKDKLNFSKNQCEPKLSESKVNSNYKNLSKKSVQECPNDYKQHISTVSSIKTPSYINNVNESKNKKLTSNVLDERIAKSKLNNDNKESTVIQNNKATRQSSSNDLNNKGMITNVNKKTEIVPINNVKALPGYIKETKTDQDLVKPLFAVNHFKKPPDTRFNFNIMRSSIKIKRSSVTRKSDKLNGEKIIRTYVNNKNIELKKYKMASIRKEMNLNELTKDNISEQVTSFGQKPETFRNNETSDQSIKPNISPQIKFPSKRADILKTLKLQDTRYFLKNQRDRLQSLIKLPVKKYLRLFNFNKLMKNINKKRNVNENIVTPGVECLSMKKKADVKFIYKKQAQPKLKTIEIIDKNKTLEKTQNDLFLKEISRTKAGLQTLNEPLKDVTTKKEINLKKIYTIFKIPIENKEEDPKPITNQIQYNVGLSSKTSSMPNLSRPIQQHRRKPIKIQWSNSINDIFNDNHKKYNSLSENFKPETKERENNAQKKMLPLQENFKETIKDLASYCNFVMYYGKILNKEQNIKKHSAKSNPSHNYFTIKRSNNIMGNTGSKHSQINMFA